MTLRGRQLVTNHLKPGVWLLSDTMKFETWY